VPFSILAPKVKGEFMASIINVHEAKTHFSKLLSRIYEGEEIVIARSGKPVARLVPIEKTMEKRMPGTAKGQINLSYGFQDEMPDGVQEEFEE
jgi:prevent-host-death family protein